MLAAAWRPKASDEAKVWAGGSPGCCDSTLQAALCSHKKKSFKKSSENNTLSYKFKEIPEDRAELQLCLHLLPGSVHSITTAGEAIFDPRRPLAKAKVWQCSPKTPRAA